MYDDIILYFVTCMFKLISGTSNSKSIHPKDVRNRFLFIFKYFVVNVTVGKIQPQKYEPRAILKQAPTLFLLILIQTYYKLYVNIPILI